MQKLTQIRWGIIGAGDVCEVKSGPALQIVENSELVAVMRRNAGKAKDFARRHGVPKWYDNATDLINDPDINAIYIATPPGSHMGYTESAAAAGKAVYVEKPMARNYGECLRMIEACEKHKVPLFVAYYRRALPNFLKVKELVENGAIGDIRYVHVKINKTLEPDIVGAAAQEENWRTNPKIAGGGYFFDLACHQLDYLDFLFGPIRTANGYSNNQAKQYEAEDITVGSFYFENGVMGQGVWCFNCGKSSDEEITTIVGSRGHISFPYFGDHSVTLKIDGEAVRRFKFDIPRNIQQPLIQTVVDDLMGNGHCPSTAYSAARTARVMDEICQMVED